MAELCCVVSAIAGSVKEEDLECLASDEVRDEDTAMSSDEIPASQVVSVTSKTGMKSYEVTFPWLKRTKLSALQLI